MLMDTQIPTRATVCQTAVSRNLSLLFLRTTIKAIYRISCILKTLQRSLMLVKGRSLINERNVENIYDGLQ